MTDSATRFAPIRSLAEGLLLESGVASMALAVAQGGEIVWEDAVGWADRERRIPATPHTMYSLASISKPITATALMTLAEQGKVDLDAPIDDYLGDARVTAHVGEARDATLRRVASHSAGLPTHCQFFYADEPRQRPPMGETILRYAHLVYPPGDEYVYSNLGYGLLEHVIERVSGLDLADYLRREVFLPLGMLRASLDVGPGLEAYAARRYTASGLPLPAYTFDHPGASAVYCSAHDLLRFGLFHLKACLPDQRAILSDASIDAMQQPVIATGEHSGYGLGWGIHTDDRGFCAVSHGGGMGGVRTHLRLLPAEGIAVVALTNGEASIHERVVAEILGLLLPEYARRHAEREAQPKETPGDSSAFDPPEELVGQWEGYVHTYAGDLPLALDVRRDGNIHVRLGDDLETLLNEPDYEEGVLHGRMMGDLGTEDARGLGHLSFHLRMRAGRLEGSVTASRPPGPDQRARNALSHWVRLERA
ncbi:MAG: beta-lactamase family protein [Chloroflexi bacterium]|nr:beta-lactamase family protein [Chloroflexota bacterium]